MALLLLFPPTTGKPILSSLRSVEEQRSMIPLELLTRQNNVDVANWTSNEEVEKSLLSFCHVINMNTFAEKVRVGPTAVTATVLALEHLNAGNGVVVDSVEGLNERCPIRFTSEFLDTENNKTTAMRQIIDIFSREPTNNSPCAFLGNTFSEVSVATSVVTGIQDVLQISVTSSAAELDDKSTHPLFARLGPSSRRIAYPLLQFMYSHLEVRHFAIIATNEAGQYALASGMKDSESRFKGLQSIPIVTLPVVSTSADYGAAVKSLKTTGATFLVAFVLPGQVKSLAEEAVKQGIAGTGMHNWIFTRDSKSSEIYRPWPTGSALAEFLRGSMWYYPGSAPPSKKGDAFAREMNALWTSEEDREFLLKKLPENLIGDPFEDINQMSTNAMAAMMYDSTILTGLAACNASQTYFTGTSHYEAVLETSFSGASGKVLLENETGSRDVSTTYFTLTNFVPDVVDPKGNTSFTRVDAAQYVDGKWNISNAIVFNDGTTEIPPDLPAFVVEKNFISQGTRILGFVLAAIVILSSGALSAWTAVERRKKSHVVVAAQPLFLHLICAGTFLMGSSIIPAGLDDDVLKSGNDGVCMATPWLASMGWCLVFSSLFAKTLRINKVFHNPQFRRVVVHVYDVLPPMTAMLASNVVVLVVWTLVAPLEWTREPVSFDQFGRITETYGSCSGENQSLFVILLIAINGSALVVANYQAFVARKIATEFAESECIAGAMGLILVVLFIAVPVNLVASSSDASVQFFVTAGFLFVVSMSVLLFIFVPKVIHSIKHRKGDIKPVRSAIRSSIGLKSKNSFDSYGGSAALETANQSTSSDDSERPGCAVVHHPQQLRKLKAENEALRAIIAKRNIAMPGV